MKFMDGFLLQEIRDHINKSIDKLMEPLKNSVAVIQMKLESMNKWFIIRDAEFKEKLEEFEELKQGIMQSQLYLEQEIEKLFSELKEMKK